MSFNFASFDTATPNPAWHDVFPVGFRFRPEDDELITSYLGPKNRGEDYPERFIAEEAVFKIEPSGLPERSKIKSDDQMWFFFCLRDFKFKKGNQYNRATQQGYWKPQGKPRPIKVKHTKEVIGSKRTLVFHHGRPKGPRSQWVMHEYECSPNSGLSNQGDFVVCKLMNESAEKYPKYDADYLQTKKLSQPPKSIIPNSHTKKFPSLLASDTSLFHNQNNGIGEILSQMPSQTPKITLQTSNNQNSDSVGAITTSICCYQNNDITEVDLSQQTPQIPKTTLQTSDIQTFDSPPAINSSLCHYQNNGISEFTLLDHEEQANANYSKVFEDSFHCDASDGYPISPSQSAIFGGAVVDSTPDVTDSLMVSDFENQNLDNLDGIPSASVEAVWSPSMATSYTDYGTQNQYENFDKLDHHDGLFASDLESKNEEPEENSESSSELWALLDSLNGEFPTLDP